MPPKKTERTKKRLCICCQQVVSARTEYRHRMLLQAPLRIKASSYQRHINSQVRQQPQSGHGSSNESVAVNSADSDMLLLDYNDPPMILEGGEANEPEMFDYSAVGAAMSNAGRNWSQVEHYESDEDSEDPQFEDIDVNMNGTDGEDEDIGPSGLHISDELGEGLERALAAIGELAQHYITLTDLSNAADELSDVDKLILRAFSLKVRNHMTEDTFEKLAFVFPSEPLPSLKETKSRVAFLSGLNPTLYDCCSNSCCCYVGPHASLTKCP